jgi:hypothetical protein
VNCSEQQIKQGQPRSRRGDAFESEGRTCNALFPSGTLLSLPILGSELKTDGQIEPGESVDVIVIIRTSGTGKQDFYMLFRYELAEAEAIESPRYRWLKNMFTVPPLRCLPRSRHRIHPSFLSVELANLRTDKLKLILERFSLASWTYELKTIQGQLDGDCCQLGWQERATLHYKVIQTLSSCSGSLLSECQVGEIAVPTDKNAMLSNSVMTFLCLERAHQRLEETFAEHKTDLARAAVAHNAKNQHPHTIAQIRESNKGVVKWVDGSEDSTFISSGTHATSIDRFGPQNLDNDAVHLICSWRGEDASIQGQQLIRGLCVRPSDKSRGCPVTVTARHPSVFSNNVKKGPACVPVSIVLRSRLVKAPATLKNSECVVYQLLVGPEDMEQRIYKQMRDFGDVQPRRRRAGLRR